MNNVLKQRLVGALILLALGVVFWPIIFVEPGDSRRDDRERMPPRPVVDTSPVEAPDLGQLRPSPEIEARRQVVEEAAQQTALQTTQLSVTESDAEAEPEPAMESMAQVEPAAPVAANPAANPEPISRTRTQAPEKPALDSDGVPIAWILQVVSVSDSAKAEELRTRLLAMEHKAYVKKVRRGDKTLYRVYIGPKFEKARLEQIRGQIDKEFGVNSMIVRYLP